MDDYYALLGVARYSNDMDVIRRAYREQIKYFHPDHHNVSPEIAHSKTVQLNEIWDVFCNAEKKADYDSKLRMAMSSSSASGQSRAQSQSTSRSSKSESSTKGHNGDVQNQKSQQSQQKTTDTTLPTWTKNIFTSASFVSAKQFSTRIFASSPGASAFKRSKINSQDIYDAFFKFGYLEKRIDKYGNPVHYFPTDKGIRLGIRIEDRNRPQNMQYGKMQISTFGEQAQLFFIQNCLRGLLK